MNEHNVVIAVVSMRNESIARKLRLGALLVAIGCGIGMSGCASTSDGNYLSGASQPASAASTRSQDSPRSKTHAAEEKLGIQLAGLRLSAAGYMLDFRYKVIDPDKAAPLLNRKIRPYLLDEASGAQLGVPDTAKLGQLRTTGRNKVVAEQDYFILFANPGRFVHAGNKMTLVMGDLRIENLTVE